jgi:hypothetical protein
MSGGSFPRTRALVRAVNGLQTLGNDRSWAAANDATFDTFSPISITLSLLYN